MIAYVRMQLLRWLRRTLGAGLLVAAVFLPTFAALLYAALGMEATGEPSRRSLVGIVEFCVLVGSGISIVNQLSSVVEEEVRLRRSALLRVGNLDGFRAVGAFSLLGLVLAVLHGTAGYAGPALVGLFVGVPAAVWVAPSAATTLLLSAFAPPAVLGAFLLPRVLGLILLNSAALVAATVLATIPAFADGGVPPGLVAGILGLHVVAFAGGGLLWRARSSAVW